MNAAKLRKYVMQAKEAQDGQDVQDPQVELGAALVQLSADDLDTEERLKVLMAEAQESPHFGPPPLTPPTTIARITPEQLANEEFCAWDSGLPGRSSSKSVNISHGVYLSLAPKYRYMLWRLRGISEKGRGQEIIKNVIEQMYLDYVSQEG